MSEFHLTEHQDSLISSELTVAIDGKSIINSEQLYKSISQQLSLPDYFGENLDALFDVLTDAETFDEKNIVFTILNYDELLIEEPSPFKKELILLLADVKSEWESSDVEISFRISCIESEELLGDLQELGISYYRDEF